MSETMADYEDQINASFRSFREGDTVTGEVVSVEEEEVLLDLRGEGMDGAETENRARAFR